MKHKLFSVSYDGLWLGGFSIVRAKDEDEARELVRNDIRTQNFELVTVTELKVRGSMVIMNENGDY